MICSNCDAENVAGAKFCNECGAALNAGCPSCGAINKPGAKFCNECGTTLGTQAVAAQGTSGVAPATGSQAERRLVTVLFADLVGFTPFAEEHDAEEVRDTLSRYFELCSEVVTRYGGTVEKFIGDAVMAVWGAPTAFEDDAERAVRAALELVDAVRTLGPDAQARAGVLTGEAAVTIGATNQGMVAGDLVNTAARLQSVAPSGTVLVGEATYRAASGGITFEEAGGQTLKGKQSPVPAWRAVRVVAERGGRNRSEGLEAPFVGRADELRLLKELFHATGRERRIRLVSVMGPAGIGKTRLAWEFLKYVDGVLETIYWHSGRSPAYGDGITFWALGEMVRGRCGLLENDDEATTRAKLAEALAQWVPDADERTWIEPALLTLLGIESGFTAEQLFAAWRTFFERIANVGTVALVFEDMHFADAGLLDFIDHMLEWSRGFPIYIVTLARPELLERRPDWGAGKRNFTSLFLEPLPEADMRDLLGGLVPGLPDGAAARIIERADGMPLYAVETVRMLLAEGRLKEEGGVYVPVGDLTSLAVPETLTALIASRLDALPGSNRSVLHAASVLGQSFTVAALSAVSGVGLGELEEQLKTLGRRELLTRDVDPRSPELGQWAFVQALIREVAYNTLSRKDRKSLHLAAARYFEHLGSDELAGALANHYLAARENAAEGAEADALGAQAKIALRAAGDRAKTLGGQEQATSFYEQAASVATDPTEQAELLERAGRADSTQAHHERAGPLLRRALELYERVGDRRGSARALGALGWDLLNDRQSHAARELLEQALEAYGDLWPDPVIVELKVNLVRAHNTSDQAALAIPIADEVLEAAEHADLVPLIARGLVGKGAALGTLGRQREAIALIRAGGDLARENELNDVLIAALVVEGFHLGEIDSSLAMARFREGLALSKRLGELGQVAQFVNNIGYTGFLVGDWDEALAELDAVLSQELDVSGRVWLTSNALIIRCARGESIDDGVAELDRLVAEHGDPGLALPTLDTKANLAQAVGRTAEARAHWLAIARDWASQAPASYYQAARHGIWDGDLASLREDLAALDATGFHGRVVEVRRTTLRAAEAALDGRTAEAHRLYKEALGGWRELHVVWDEALTGIDMVTVLDPAEPDVRATADSTREILARLRAQPYLDRLDRLFTRAGPGGAPVTAQQAPAVAADSA